MNGTKPKKAIGNGCTLYKKCGGCQLQNMDYQRQLRFKQATVVKLIGKYCRVDDIIGMSEPYHYRHKVQAAFGKINSNIVSGVYQSSTHRIVKVDNCLIENKQADRIIVTIRHLLKEFKLGVFNEKTLKGFLRHVLVRVGYYTNEIMVVMVTGTKEFPKKRDFIKRLLEIHPEITTVVQSVNNKFTTLVLGKEFITLYGRGYIYDNLCGCTFKISPASFYQINPQQTEILYNTAVDFMGLGGNETVIDAYCGTGTIGLIASKNAKRVIGVELNSDAVRDAKTNARLNKADNITFFNADAGRFMVDMAAGGEKADVVIMDPPRAGSDRNFIKSVLTLSPKKVVYVSCNPETLARDLRFFVSGGYKVRKAVPVDMFPHTKHVETVVQLVRKNPDTYIDITVDKDELDLISSEAKATYEEIKDYIFERFGLKVSSLNIAQVKTKCGIIERGNYNKPKSENTKQPQCTKNKEEAIMNALRHFKMI